MAVHYLMKKKDSQQKKLKVEEEEVDLEDLEVEMDHQVVEVIFAIIVVKKDIMLKTVKNLLKEENLVEQMEGVLFVMRKVIKRQIAQIEEEDVGMREEAEVEVL